MELTEKRAIELSIELWKWLAETGKEKHDWPSWEKYGMARGECFLCEYDDQQNKGHNCCSCPYFKKFGCCGGSDDCSTFYEKWETANTRLTRKKCALKFLNQLRELVIK